jgi:hypothetical protein
VEVPDFVDGGAEAVAPRITLRAATASIRKTTPLRNAPKDEIRAVSPEEKTTAGLLCQVEVRYAWAATRERNRRRLLTRSTPGTSEPRPLSNKGRPMSIHEDNEFYARLTGADERLSSAYFDAFCAALLREVDQVPMLYADLAHLVPRLAWNDSTSAGYTVASGPTMDGGRITVYYRGADPSAMVLDITLSREQSRNAPLHAALAVAAVRVHATQHLTRRAEDTKSTPP